MIITVAAPNYSKKEKPSIKRIPIYHENNIDTLIGGDSGKKHMTRKMELCIKDVAELLRGNKVMRNIFIVCFVFPLHDDIYCTTDFHDTSNGQLKVTQHRQRSIAKFTPIRPTSKQNFVAVHLCNGDRTRGIHMGSSLVNVLNLARVSNSEMLLIIIVIPVHFLSSPWSPIANHHMRYERYYQGSWHFRYYSDVQQQYL